MPHSRPLLLALLPRKNQPPLRSAPHKIRVCALRSLQRYALVGLVEEQAASVCLLMRSLGLRPQGALDAREIHTYPVAPDFELAHGSKYAMDLALHEAARRHLARQLRDSPECAQLRVGGTR